MYKQRFVIEYNELTERIGKLENMLTKYANGKLDFEPDCPITLLKEQLKVMTEYQHILKKRSVIEGIDIK